MSDSSAISNVVEGPFLGTSAASKLLGEDAKGLYEAGRIPGRFVRRTKGGHLRIAARDFVNWDGGDAGVASAGAEAASVACADPIAFWRSGEAMVAWLGDVGVDSPAKERALERALAVGCG